MGFGINHPLDENGRRIVQKKRVSIRRKACREAKRNIAQRRVIKRQSSRRVGAVICYCPGIGQEIESVVKKMWKLTRMSYCQANSILNPVEILRCLQKAIVTGRILELDSDSEVLEGESNCISVDRMNLLETTLEEVGALQYLRLTLEVSFNGEVGHYFP